MDRYGKPHSLHRIPSIKDKGLRQADFPAAFGFDANKMAKRPTLKATQRNIKMIHNVRRTTNKIIRAFGKIGRIYKNALSLLRSRSYLGNRGRTQGIALLALVWGVSRISQRDELRPVRGTRDRDGKVTQRQTPKPRASRIHATKGWWVDAKAEGIYKSMIAAGATEEAETAVDRIYLEEEQRIEGEQRYLDWLQGYDPKRRDLAISSMRVEPIP